MFEVKFKDDKKYSGEYGKVTFVEGVAKVEDSWLAAWFAGREFKVTELKDDSKIEQDNKVELKSLKIDKLKALASEKGIEFDTNIKKEELLKLLEGTE